MTHHVIILIAEDDTGHFTLVQKNLWRSAVQNEILHFPDGQALLDFFFDPEAEPRVASDASYLILLDIRLPKVDGVEVLRRLKADEELARIPVIMLTTTDDPVEVRRCHELGCSFYIPKPTDYNAFMDCVENLGRLLSLEEVKVPRPSSPTDAPKHRQARLT